jgi:glycosyltransferase involved in cell wall biosynthesis
VTVRGRPDLAVVSAEPLWPAVHGGRIRTAGITEELSRHFSVCVVAPREGEPPDAIRLEALPNEPARRGVGLSLHASPRLALALLGPARRADVAGALARHRPRVVVFTASWLAEALTRHDDDPPFAVDFIDVEARRMASLARGGSPRCRVAYGLEALKARRWEPAVARRASARSAASPADAARLASWGAPPVLVPNGAALHDPCPSPSDGPLLFLASFSYQPNRDAARWLVEDVWPHARRAEPAVRLVVAGRAADPAWAREGVAVVPDPPCVDDLYAGASAVLAPVRRGGGAQVKVTEALARGRVVVASRFSATAVPPAAAPGVVVAADARRFADHAVRLWRDPVERWDREKALVAARPVPTWEEACAPLVDALRRLVAAR